MSVEITDRSALPYSAVCYITVTFPNGFRARGSGVVVGSNDVLTAMHVVYSAPDGGCASSITINPGADSEPFMPSLGSFSDVGSREGRTANWDRDGDGLLLESESQNDLALLGLRSRIGDVTGWVQLDASRQSLEALVLGYPNRGTGLMGDVFQATPTTGFSLYSLDGSLGPGASGGPLLADEQGLPAVLGVLSSGTSNLTQSRYAALYGNDNLAWLQDVISANDSLVAAVVQKRFYGQLSDDDLRGNTADNLIAGSGGNDTLRGGGGRDTLDGGPGTDTTVLAGPRNDYALNASATGWSVTDSAASRDGVLTLSGIERLRFADQSLALDLDGVAGAAVRLIGVVLGPQAVADARVVGVAIDHLDKGMSAQALARLGLDAVLGPRTSADPAIALMWSHLFDRLPSEAEVSFVQSLMAAQGLDEACLAVYAASLDLNAARIGLTGLASAGVAYLQAA